MNSTKPASNCLNCETAIEHVQNFCPNCGQKTKTHRLSIVHFFHESFHAFTHADRTIFHLLKSLAIRPGFTAREYLQGRRKTYFNPFTFLLLTMGIFVFLDVNFGPAAKKIQPDSRVLAWIPTQEAKQQYISAMSRVDQVTRLTHNNGKVMAMIAIPFISLITWLFFRKRKYNYAEHLTANLMFITFSNLIFLLLVFPLRSIFTNTPENYIILIGLVLQGLYLAWCLNGFLGLRSPASRTKSFAVIFLAIILWMVFTISAMAIYIYQNKDFYKFFTQMFA
jgi:Protein of unknown function (DUF3667)